MGLRDLMVIIIKVVARHQETLGYIDYSREIMSFMEKDAIHTGKYWRKIFSFPRRIRGYSSKGDNTHKEFIEKVHIEGYGNEEDERN